MGREMEQKRSFTYWFTPQMAVTVDAGPWGYLLEQQSIEPYPSPHKGGQEQPQRCWAIPVPILSGLKLALWYGMLEL